MLIAANKGEPGYEKFREIGDCLIFFEGVPVANVTIADDEIGFVEYVYFTENPLTIVTSRKYGAVEIRPTGRPFVER